ncbi:lysophospholipid acyltransferase family protein [Streptomyces sp. NPDC051920]|uniref:lysophospholipid acyltransferase family protein n=1 Tax=Streptomyces sp. NPDC051920 TaxID=3155523 RepID=UPI00342C0D6C
MSTPRTGALRPTVLVRPRSGGDRTTTPLPEAAPPPRPTSDPATGPGPAPRRPAAGPVRGASAWLPTAPCSPRGCVESARPWTGVPRAVLRLAALLAVVVLGVALVPLAGLLPDRPRQRWIRRWCLAVVHAAGVRTRITGAAPPTGGVLIVADHVSWLDIPLLAAVRPARMVAKTEVRGWPVLGALAARGGTLFIDRDRLRALPGTVDRVAEALRGGSAVAAFPEGSTWCGRARGRYRRALFQAALDAGVPVQPVRIRYRSADGAASTAPAFVGEDSLLASLWRVVSARGLVAETGLCPPLPAGSHPDRRSLAEAAQASAGAPGPRPGMHP